MRKFLSILLVSLVFSVVFLNIPSVFSSTGTLMPNAVGDLSQNTPVGDTPNYKCCDESPHDSDGTYVKSSATDDLGQIDLYNLQVATGTIPAGETITNVAVVMTVRSVSATYKAVFQTKIKTGGTEYTGVAVHPSTTYTEYTTNYALNPKTGLAWTLADLDALQAGAYIESLYREATGTYYVGRMTQVRVVVTHIAPSGEERSFTLIETMAPTSTLNQLQGHLHQFTEILIPSQILNYWQEQKMTFIEALLHSSILNQWQEHLYELFETLIPSSTIYQWQEQLYIFIETISHSAILETFKEIAVIFFEFFESISLSDSLEVVIQSFETSFLIYFILFFAAIFGVFFLLFLGKDIIHEKF